MNIQIIDNHSVAVDLLKGGPVLDAGARGFRFARWFAERGHRVVALDPAPDMSDPKIDRVHFYNVGLVATEERDGTWYHVECDDKEASYITRARTNCLAGVVDIRSFQLGQWDLVKLNIEGSEYDILDNWPGPIANQIVFSFHEHTDRKRGREECDRIIDKLRQWYDIHNQVWEPRYCTYANYWDVLAIKKGLA